MQISHCKHKVLKIIASVATAFFGVQSKKARQEDFQAHHKPWHYILTGIALALLFVLAVALLSSYLVHNL